MKLKEIYKMSEILDAWESAYGEDMFIEYSGFIQKLTEDKSKEKWEENKK